MMVAEMLKDTTKLTMFATGFCNIGPKGATAKTERGGGNRNKGSRWGKDEWARIEGRR
jgi:hypothetical protein